MTYRWGKMVSMLFLGAFFLIGTSYSDEVIIPFAVYVDDFKTDMKNCGIDLYDDRHSDGFIKNEGTKITIFTYRSLTIDELQTIKDLCFKHHRRA